MFCIDICFFGAGAGRSRAFIGGAGADIFYLEPDPKKISNAGSGSTTLFHSTVLSGKILQELVLEPEPKLWTKGGAGAENKLFRIRTTGIREKEKEKPVLL